MNCLKRHPETFLDSSFRRKRHPSSQRTTEHGQWRNSLTGKFNRVFSSRLRARLDSPRFFVQLPAEFDSRAHSRVGHRARGLYSARLSKSPSVLPTIRRPERRYLRRFQVLSAVYVRPEMSERGLSTHESAHRCR